MTTPAQPPPYDAGNTLLGEQPAQQSLGLVDGPEGQRLALTIRTPSTTLTVLLSAADAKAWAASLSGAAGAMSGSGLVVAGPGALLNGKAAG